MTDNKAMLNIGATLQKFVDMSMSINLYYNYDHYEDGNIPLSTLIKDQLYGYKYGLKNFTTQILQTVTENRKRGWLRGRFFTNLVLLI